MTNMQYIKMIIIMQNNTLSREAGYDGCDAFFPVTFKLKGCHLWQSADF